MGNKTPRTATGKAKAKAPAKAARGDAAIAAMSRRQEPLSCVLFQPSERQELYRCRA